MMHKLAMLILISFILLSPIAVYAGSDDILGVWDNQEKSAKIELFRCGEKYAARSSGLKSRTIRMVPKRASPAC